MRTLAIALLAFVAACATPVGDPRQQIIALEEAWHQSDVAQLESILAPDFERHMPNGEVWDRERQLTWLRSRPPASGFTHRFESMTVTVNGDTATATGVAALVNAEGVTVDRNAFTDTYAYTDGQWRLRSARRTQVR